MTPEVPLCFRISLIDAAPGGPKEEIGNVARIEPLPLSDLGGGLILFRATNQGRSKRSELRQNVLFQPRAHIRRRRKICLSTGVAALAAHVDEIGKRLRSGSPFVKIGPFAPERIRGNYALGLELVVTDGTTKLDLTQRCHGYSSFQRFEAQKYRGISVPRF
jgi:hypothetical protein